MKIVSLLCVALMVALTPGCGSLSELSSNVKRGAMMGGAAGAVTGGVIGAGCGGSSSTMEGMIIGGGLGAIAGGIVGAMKDRHCAEPSSTEAAVPPSYSAMDRQATSALYRVEMQRYDMDGTYSEEAVYQTVPRYRTMCVVPENRTVYCTAPYPVVPEAYPSYVPYPYGY